MKRVRIKYRKLGRHKADGLYWEARSLIEIDERIGGKLKLEVLVHECLHHIHPELTEEAVDKKAKEMANMLWSQNLRWANPASAVRKSG